MQEADAWFVIEDLTPNDLSCAVPKRQVHFLSAETAWVKDKFLSRHKTRFLRQFSELHTFYQTKHHRQNFAPPFLPWMINANHATVFRAHARDINFFTQLRRLPKSKKLSMFCSNQTLRPEHRRRLEFAKAAKAHFGEDIEWFGRGIHEIEEKWEGLAAFERTIVLENTYQPGVFSEKILDPYLALSSPIYGGSTNIASNFPIAPDNILDLSDFDESIKRIARLLDQDISSEEHQRLLLGKELVLTKHHFLRRICRIAKATASSSPRKLKRKLQDLKPSMDFRP